jgi:predicted GNAT family acetyltransferase
MLVQHKQNGSGGIFFIQDDHEDTVAALTYDQKDPGSIIIEHTQVDKALRGKDVGDQLIYKAVEFARSRHLKIHPVCSFARAVFEMKKEYRDVYAEVED